MAHLEEVQGILRALPETDPGPGFYAAIRRQIDELGPNADLPAIREPISLGDLLRRALSPLWLRPAAGLALGLVAGVVIGFAGGQLGETGGPPVESPGLIAEAPRPDPTGSSSSDAALVGSSSPLADLDLSHLSQLADSLGMGAEEYILEPYVTDPQRGLVPEGDRYSRTVGSGGGNEQPDAYITF
jgi:hypothetical protein